MASNRRLSTRPTDITLDTISRHVRRGSITQRLPVGRRDLHDETPASTPGTTPTTPHGHPLSNPFTNILVNRTQPTPVPLVKIFPLCVARVSEGLIFAVIFPYINEMMHDFGVPEKMVGVWSATAESTMMVTEALSAPLYAPLADRFGRRPVFLNLVFMWGIFAIAFGFASSPLSAVSLRAMLGLLAGAGVLSRTMAGEMCDKTNRVQAFSLFSPAFTVGVTIAPLIGGFLSRPVPRLLPQSFSLLVAHPYLLPSAVVGMSGLLAAALGYYLLPETLPPTLRNQGAQRHEAEKASSAGGLKALIMYPKFQNVLILYGLNNMVMFEWEAIYPLFAYTDKGLGGLGLSTPQIGVILAFGAGLSIVMTIWLFPILHRSMPEGTVLRLCLMAYPAAVVLFPLLWAANHRSEGMSSLAVFVLVVQMLMRRTGDFASTLLDTIVMDAIPGPEYLAMANSITFSMAAVGRAIGPFIVSTFFSYSTGAVSSTTPQRQIVWLVMALSCLPSVWFAQRVVDDSTTASRDTEDDEEKYDPSDSALDD